MMPTMMREPHAVTLTPAFGGSLPTFLGLEVKFIADRYVKPFGHDHSSLLSSPPCIP